MNWREKCEFFEDRFSYCSWVITFSNSISGFIFLRNFGVKYTNGISNIFDG